MILSFNINQCISDRLEWLYFIVKYERVGECGLLGFFVEPETAENVDNIFPLLHKIVNLMPNPCSFIYVEDFFMNAEWIQDKYQSI